MDDYVYIYIYIIYIVINGGCSANVKAVSMMKSPHKEPICSHGQLYIAASRVGDPQHLPFAVGMSDCRRTRNATYEEIHSVRGALS